MVRGPSHTRIRQYRLGRLQGRVPSYIWYYKDGTNGGTQPFRGPSGQHRIFSKIHRQSHQDHRGHTITGTGQSTGPQQSLRRRHSRPCRLEWNSSGSKTGQHPTSDASRSTGRI